MAKRRGYAIKKRLVDLGLKRGTGHVFRPVRRPLEPNIVLTDERLRVHANVFWFGAALLYAVAGSIPLLTQMIGLIVPSIEIPADLATPRTTALSGIALLLAATWLYLARRGVHAMPWMNVIVGAGTLLIGVAAITSQQYGPDMLTYLLIPAMAAAFFMPLKQGARHIAVVAAIMLYVGFTSSEVSHGRMIALNILFFTLLAATMLIFARRRIQAGIVHNVALAGRDPLTGVANLRKFNERLQTEIDRCNRKDQPLTLLMIDLDDFKLVNDKYSYTLGDAVLVASARAMNRVVRADELLARRGGDEFAIIALGADVEDANALADRVKTAVRHERSKLCPDVSPEASIGVAEWRTGETPSELMRRADSALHVSKLIAHSQEPFFDL
ncbi:MAG: GGDEF domain-containing protein [Solirubrobacterales bacterium]